MNGNAQMIQALGQRLEVIEARLDDIAAMLGEVFDQLHPCQECIDDRAIGAPCEHGRPLIMCDRPHRRTTSVERRHLTLTIEPLSEGPGKP